MQTPYRKYDKVPRQKRDAVITEEKLQELLRKKDRLIKINRPKEAAEVKRLALMGDFSENAGYQLAKSRLRGINSRILEIDDILRRAEIIYKNPDCQTVEVGHTVTLDRAGEIKEYTILGSIETDPSTGFISYQSPLGSLLLGKKVGDIIKPSPNNPLITYKIIKIS